MHQLILHPLDMNAEFDSPAILAGLNRIGLIGDDFELAGERHYRPGEHFLELITFLGCSPVVSLGEPGLTGDEFCYISLLPLREEPFFLHGDNIKPPRCPNCRHANPAWKQLIQAWQQDRQAYRYTCPECQGQYPLPRLKWRQSAGFLRSGIVIWGIHEGEAVPSEQLLDTLRQTSHIPWGYFYLSQS